MFLKIVESDGIENLARFLTFLLPFDFVPFFHMVNASKLGKWAFVGLIARFHAFGIIAVNLTLAVFTNCTRIHLFGKIAVPCFVTLIVAAFTYCNYGQKYRLLHSEFITIFSRVANGLDISKNLLRLRPP